MASDMRYISECSLVIKIFHLAYSQPFDVKGVSKRAASGVKAEILSFLQPCRRLSDKRSRQLAAQP